VRVRRVAELAPAQAVAANRPWAAHTAAVAHLPVAAHDDLRWADGFAFGTPSRFGAPAAQLKQFIDTTGGLWVEGALRPAGPLRHGDPIPAPRTSTRRRLTS
jgi:NAD(P)H dehydrogenase (quinone)